MSRTIPKRDVIRRLTELGFRQASAVPVAMWNGNMAMVWRLDVDEDNAMTVLVGRFGGLYVDGMLPVNIEWVERQCRQHDLPPAENPAGGGGEQLELGLGG